MWIATRLKSVQTVTGRVSRGCLAILVPPIDVMLVNRKIAAAPVAEDDIEALADDDLKKLVESEWVRAKELDDKLQKLTAALSVSVTVGGLVATTILQDLALSGLKIVAGILFLIAALLLLCGVLLGFNGLRPKPRYGYGAAFMRKVARTDGTVARDALIAAACGFQRDNLIRANEASAATDSIRNGVITFVVALLAGLIATTAGKPPSDISPPEVVQTNSIR